MTAATGPLTGEDIAVLQNIAALNAIREGVRERISDIDYGMSHGQVRNVAHTRGYLAALHDLLTTLNTVLDTETGGTDGEPD